MQSHEVSSYREEEVDQHEIPQEILAEVAEKLQELQPANLEGEGRCGPPPARAVKGSNRIVGQVSLHCMCKEHLTQTGCVYEQQLSIMLEQGLLSSCVVLCAWLLQLLEQGLLSTCVVCLVAAVARARSALNMCCVVCLVAAVALGKFNEGVVTYDAEGEVELDLEKVDYTSLMEVRRGGGGAQMC